MASRRDQLNAYTFARKRMVAAFLQPSASGSEEGAPRPLRAIVPSVAVAALLLAGFGGWGLIKPSSPPGWNVPYAKVLVGSESTTRYVVTGTTKHPELHPVLNLASAKLLLDPTKFGVLKVDESVLDNGTIPHGPTLGIPYAPDRMPDAGDAGTAKLWSVCEQPGRAADPDKAAFVLAARDAWRVDGTGRLSGDQALYVQGPAPARTRYLVDPRGTAFPLEGGTTPGATGTADEKGLLERAIFGDGAQPQQVTADWLRTLNQGTPLAFPDIPGFGDPAGLSALGSRDNRIGMVIEAPSGTTVQKYVVLRNKVERISALVAQLLLLSPDAPALYGRGTPQAQPVDSQKFNPDPAAFTGGGPDWPSRMPHQANGVKDSTVCSVYRGTMKGSRAGLSVWTGTRYPATVVNGGATAYVTPGSGLLYRQVTGTTTSSGALYLVTDTGLRYNVPGTSGDTDVAGAQVLLGYGSVTPVPVPQVWSAFLPTGPQLDPKAAAQQQGS
ncbi:type VII secretion protein EccB [Streptantibioticus silvisoli]|uniref:Type VII secretion protein EccB n=1 Tax=Streptantibioticus silvisoli TaxID=2705255 RepID=A0ABT6W3K6_9ACTN|nr:type VII secretion protein EccB [Streptantibioticus silvisoli]MDI5965325.1 type VII secretion protein EccB [Streptantibioticus silvisoli]